MHQTRVRNNRVLDGLIRMEFRNTKHAALRLGLSRSHLQRMLYGYLPSDAVQVRLADYFGIPVEILFYIPGMVATKGREYFGKKFHFSKERIEHRVYLALLLAEGVTPEMHARDAHATEKQIISYLEGRRPMYHTKGIANSPHTMAIEKALDFPAEFLFYKGDEV